MKAQRPRTPDVTAPEAQTQPQQAPARQPTEEQPPTHEAPPDGQSRAMFSSAGHMEAGDSVSGQPVEVHGVTFTPGQLNALVDFVGTLDHLEQFTHDQLVQMQELLKADNESALAWEAATGGQYSKLCLANADHFAPGAGPDAHDSFVSCYAAAWGSAQAAAQHEEGSTEYEAAMKEARLSLYSAEHYLEDAFAAGHKVSEGDIEAAVDQVWSAGFVLEDDDIAAMVFAKASSTISGYAYHAGPALLPIDTVDKFELVAVPAALWEGKEGVYSGLRKAMHEKLSVGVQVTSEAHPEAWVLSGDDGLSGDPISQQCIAAALTEVRAGIELEAVPGAGDGNAKAEALWSRHAPVPTAGGQALIDHLLDQATQNQDALAAAIADATAETITDVMDILVIQSNGYVVKMGSQQQPPTAPAPGDELPETGPAPGTQEPTAPGNDQGPWTYTVRKGDWLSTIAEQFYGDPMKYMVIAHANPKIQDPDLIEVGWELTIPALPAAA